MTLRALALALIGWLAIAWAGAVGAPAPPLQAADGALTQAPRWIDDSGRPTLAAREALAVLARAGDEGLDPRAYHAAALAADADALSVTGASAPARAQALETGLTRSMLLYLRHVHIGRVQPVGLGWRIASRDTEHDYAEVLDEALRSGRVAEAARTMAPPLAQYAALRETLHKYRSLAALPPPRPLGVPRKSVKPGDAFDDADALLARLVQLGDLPPGTAVLAPRYDTDLVDGVRRFQARHGLATDGVLGAATARALNVPLAQRVRQIELALERLRWLPHPDGRRVVAINIPMFRLWGWDPAAPSSAAGLDRDMGVIVGRALRTPTPVMVEELRQVVFRPYWNVPRSILRNEILPKVVRDPSYLERHDMEIVSGGGDDARPVPATQRSIERLRSGELRLRQRPGPANSLGLVKFVFPNNDNVYMHGTPATELFGRTRRDFSHGCVRLEDPVSMAEWVLAGQTPWTRERIVAAMNGARPQAVSLQRPVQVVLFYTTAAVLPRNGTLHFADDIYRHDERLERTLRTLAAP